MQRQANAPRANGLRVVTGHGHRHALALAVALAIGTTAPSAGADERAAAAFEHGIREMKAARYDAACAALAESHRLEPKLGALFTLAECEALRGKSATAIARYDEFLQAVDALHAEEQGKHRERREVALQKRAALAAEVPRLTVRLPGAAPAGSRVWLDGTELSPDQLGVMLPIDPGAHELRVVAPGLPTQQQQLTLVPHQERRVDIDLPAARPTPRAPSRRDEPPSQPSTSTARTLSYVTGGVAIAGLGVGVTTALLAVGRKATIEDHCDGLECRDQAGKDAADEAQAFAAVSTAGFVIGAAAAAAAIVLWISSEPAPRKSAGSRLVLTPSRAGAAIAF